MSGKAMKSILVSLPSALAIALFVSRVMLTTLNMPTDPAWMFGSVAGCTFLLYGRSLLELGLIGILALIAQLNAVGMGGQPIPPDFMLALLISIVLLPIGMRILDINVDLSRTE